MRTTLLCLSLSITLAACAPDDPRPAAQQSTSEVGSAGDPSHACVDADHDGFGDWCARGLDCDDADPRTTNECFRCAEPAENCACDEGARPVACDVDRNGPVIPVTCYVGQRTCVRGHWNRCTAYARRFE